MKDNRKMITALYIVFLLLTAANFIFFPERYAVQIFAIIYLTVIYKYFADSSKKFLYYTTLLFAFINAGLSLPFGSRYAVYYFYITLFIYIVIFAVEFFKGEITFNIKAFLKNKYNKFFVFFVLYMLFSIVFAESKKMAAVQIINYGIMFSLLIMIILENSNKINLKNTFKFLEYLYMGILFLGTLEIFGVRYGLRNHYFDLELTANEINFVKKIPVVFFYNPNNYAVLLVLVMAVIAVKLYYEKDKNKRILYYVIYVLSQINLIFTTCRTAWFTVFITFIFCIFVGIIKKDKSIRKFALKLTAFTFAVFLVFSFIPSMEPFYGKFQSTPLIEKLFNIDLDSKWQTKVELGSRGSVNERYTLMYDVMDGVFLKGHYLGFGAGNISNFIEKMNNTYGVLNVHSLWFEILGDFGIITFIYFVYICLSMIVDLLGSYSKHSGNIKKYSLMLVVCCFDFAFLAFAPSSVITYVPFWLMMAVAVVIVKNKDNMEKEYEDIIG